MQDVHFLIFGIISLAVTAFTVALSVRRYRNKENTGFFTPLYILLLGIFIASIVMFIPISYGDAMEKNEQAAVTPVLVAVRTALGLFVVNEEFNLVTNALADCSEFIKKAYGIYAAALYVFAPILSFSVVLSVLRMFWGEFKFRLFKNRKRLYLFTEFNEKTVLLAKSIRNLEKEYADKKADNGNRMKGKSTIAFANMPSDRYTDESEYYISAKKAGAIFLKKRVADLKPLLKKGKNRLEIFVIGKEEEEAKNISKALDITDKYKDRDNTHIYLFSSSPETGMIIDSLRKEHYEEIKEEVNLNSDAKNGGKFREKDNRKAIDRLSKPNYFPYGLFSKLKDEVNLEKGIRKTLEEYTSETDDIGNFSVIRIDPLYTMSLEFLTNKTVLSDIKRSFSDSDDELKIISIMIIGMGSIGKKILKTAVWLYQMDGYKIEFNIIDKSPDIENVLKHECPELISEQNSPNDGEAKYEINFYESKDCFSSDFDDLFKSNSERFKQTHMVFVLMGDDEKNVKASIMLRERFALLKDIDNKRVVDEFDNSDIVSETDDKSNKNGKLHELPFIFSVLYDEDNADIMGNHIKENEDIDDTRDRIVLRNYKADAPYNIKFIGNLDYQYSYKCVNDQNERENSALKYHFDWVETDDYIQRNYNNNENFRKDIEKAVKDGELDKDKQTALEEGYRKFLSGEKQHIDSYETIKNNINGILQYYRYEYYRLSSMAKAEHRERILPVFMAEALNEFELKMEHKEAEESSTIVIDKNALPCNCERCEMIRKSEHMRWMAFMRANGYRYGKNRNDRAKIHRDLKPWKKLNYIDRYKD